MESSRQAVADGRAALADLPADRLARRAAWRSASPRSTDARTSSWPTRRGKGWAAQLVESLAARAPERVVHVACDPASLARDVALFAERGYGLSRLRAFDAFPMTHHFECVALFVRS